MKARLAVTTILVVIGIGLGIFTLRRHEAYQPTTRAQKTAIDVMESDLMALAREEHYYYRVKGRFTPHAESTYFIGSIGVSPPEVTLRDSGYYAIVTHTALPGVKCAIAVGTSNPVDKSAKETFPACK